MVFCIPTMYKAPQVFFPKTVKVQKFLLWVKEERALKLISFKWPHFADQNNRSRSWKGIASRSLRWVVGWILEALAWLEMPRPWVVRECYLFQNSPGCTLTCTFYVRMPMESHDEAISDLSYFIFPHTLNFVLPPGRPCMGHKALAFWPQFPCWIFPFLGQH